VREELVALSASTRRAALIALVIAQAARAEEGDLKPTVRIQRRFVEKKGRFAAYVGFAYLGRSDFYRSPGVEVAASYYFLESFALDVRVAYLFTYETDELRLLSMKTGFVPDTQPSRSTVLVGGRWSFGYAKLKVGDRLVVHLEPQLFLYGGLHFTAHDPTDVGVWPLGEIGFGLLVHATRHVQARLDAGLTVGGERRTDYVAVVGGFPVLSVGVIF
jgi:hypothetical protein